MEEADYEESHVKPTKPLKITQVVFRVNGDTTGGSVKGRNQVLKKHKVKCRGQAHVNKFDEKKVQWVKEIGMGGLLYLIGKSLPRGLCYWLMTRVDHVKVFISSSGCEYPLDRSQVHWVLGLPYGPKVVPRAIVGERMTTFKDCVYAKYGVVTDKGSEYISISRVIEVVEVECGHGEEYGFKEAFLALALADVLCPTTCLRLEKELIPALSVAKDAVEYDWCELVLEKLLVNYRKFAQKFYRDGLVKGVGECTYFLAIFYLDRLDRPPVRWGMFPWLNDGVKQMLVLQKLKTD